MLFSECMCQQIYITVNQAEDDFWQFTDIVLFLLGTRIWEDASLFML